MWIVTLTGESDWWSIRICKSGSLVNPAMPLAREARRRIARDAAASLMLCPFCSETTVGAPLKAQAVKLDGDLVKQIHALAETNGAGINETVAALLIKGLAK